MKRFQQTVVLFFIILWVPGLLMLWPVSLCRAGGQIVDRIVAVVNDDIIVLSEFNEALRPYLERIRNMPYSPGQQRQMVQQVESEILMQLIDKKLTDQEIKRHQLAITTAEVDDAVEGFKRTYGLNEAELVDVLKRDGLTLEAYRRHVEEQILRSMLVNREVKSRIVMTQTDIENYYKQHPERYGGELRYHLNHILLRIPAYASVREKEELRTQMEAMHIRLKAGTSIADVLRDPAATAAIGGDLGLFTLDALAPEIRRAVEGRPAGAITDILETDHGYQLFMITDIVQTDPRPLDVVAAEIEDQLYREILDQRFEQWLSNLRTRSHIKILDSP